jgi:serine/threonine-protein kinase RsbW/stage II sporulation protein AB (anti-sigma F factor)
MPSASWTHRAEPDCVASLRNQIVGFASEHRVTDPPLGDLKLAVSEAATNAVLHAFVDDATPGALTGTIHVDAGAGCVTVRVCDDGAGMIPRSNSTGLGLGLPLIAQIADEFSIRAGAEGVGTEVCMTFAYSAA